MGIETKSELNKDSQIDTDFKIKSDKELEKEALESFEESKEFYRSENILLYNNLMKEINRYKNSFGFELKMKKSEEIGEYEKQLADKFKNKEITKQEEEKIKGDLDQLIDLRKSYFDKSIETLLMLRGNKLINTDDFVSEFKNLYDLKSLKNEQRLNYDREYVILLDNLKLLEKDGQQVLTKDQYDNYLGGKLLNDFDNNELFKLFYEETRRDHEGKEVKININVRNKIVDIYRENQDKIKKLLWPYHGDDLKLLYFGKINNDEIKKVQVSQN